jgi:hypothetical protein
LLLKAALIQVSDYRLLGASGCRRGRPVYYCRRGRPVYYCRRGDQFIIVEGGASLLL